VRNFAFSIVMAALAVMEIAVVATALAPTTVQTAQVRKSDSSARQVLASNQTGRKAAAF